MRTPLLAFALAIAATALLGLWPAAAWARILPPAAAASLPLPPPPAPPPPAPPASPTEAAVPAAPPPAPVLPPPLVVPTRAAEPLPVVPLEATAAGAATAIPGGLRVTFGPGSAELNPATAAALADLAAHAARQTDFDVAAYAPGAADDPSSPRRLSLERALGVRAVLLAHHVASPHIFLHAYGATHAIAAGPVDRADVTLTPPSSPARPAP